MIRLRWREKWHTFFGGKLIGREYNADEGYVTQHLELGMHEAAGDVDRMLQDLYLRP